MSAFLFSAVPLAFAIAFSATEPANARRISQAEVEQRYGNPADGSFFIVANGTRVHCRRQGSGEPLFYLHGVIDSLHTWEDLWAALPGFEHIGCDIPGFGLSDPINGGTFQSFSDNIDATHLVLRDVFRQLGLTQTTMIGHSLGGLLLWTYAVKFPSQVRSLVLVNAAAYPQRVPPLAHLGGELGRILLSVTPRLLSRPLLLWGYEVDLRWSLLRSPDAVANLDAKVVRLVDLLISDGNVESYMDIIKQMLNYDFRHHTQVRELKLPVLIALGMHDRTVPAWDNLPQWSRDLPQAAFSIHDNAGHIVHWESVPKLAEDILIFTGRKFSRHIRADETDRKDR